jgi:hypothetical protein
MHSITKEDSVSIVVDLASKPLGLVVTWGFKTGENGLIVGEN